MIHHACGLAAASIVSISIVAWGQPVAPPPAPEKTTTAKAKAEYLEVPLVGEFGKEILAGGVKKALVRAKAERIEHIVFVVDSGGGTVADAEAIAEVLKQYDGSFTYHAVIKKAFSAPLWVLTQCDHWYCIPGSAAGAAVVYSLRESTGSMEVDAKRNGAVAAVLASAAESKGLSGDTIRAMVLMEAKLYLNPPGARGLSRLSAVQAEGGQEIDGEQAVLSVSMNQMVDWGLAKALPLDGSLPAEAVGKLIGMPRWRSGGNVGVGAMKMAGAAFQAAVAERDRACKQFDAAVTTMNEGVKAFNASAKAADNYDPNRIYISEYRGSADREDIRRFNAEVDSKVGRLNDALAAARGVAAAQSSARVSLTAFENAHRRAAEAAGLAPGALAVEKPVVPEIPKDFQAAAERVAADAASWARRRR